MLVQSIAIALVYGFFLFEMTGLTAGGLIAPGYFGLSFDQPWLIGLCLLTAFSTMLLTRCLSYVTILYGRRRFLVSVLMGFALQWVLLSLFMGTELGQGRIEVVGYIIPGLVASEMDRQGPLPTLLALLVLSTLVFLSMKLLLWLQV
ncbi:poly-gamma-glutamate biosynthesis protein PgsC [uncultured Cohaesibacter sp.]|uniref:poly-gamma-glutamate biosynthesis protein PgsC n=1 Tax=uncultured Cohaesibacter sp. TaxID=1002546 RepID=UPI00292DE56F|nr:poly-gamma-glutamate biosynthesis protein PgsC [uncultured Cohaesibacter sp.]